MNILPLERIVAERFRPLSATFVRKLHWMKDARASCLVLFGTARPFLTFRGERSAQLECVPRSLSDFADLFLQEVLVPQVFRQTFPPLGAHLVVVVGELSCVDDRRLDKVAGFPLQSEPFRDARNTFFACVRADDVYSLPLEPLHRSAQIVAVAPSNVAHACIGAVWADHVASNAAASGVVVKMVGKG